MGNRWVTSPRAARRAITLIKQHTVGWVAQLSRVAGARVEGASERINYAAFNNINLIPRVSDCSKLRGAPISAIAPAQSKKTARVWFRSSAAPGREKVGGLP